MLAVLPLQAELFLSRSSTRADSVPAT